MAVKTALDKLENFDIIWLLAYANILKNRKRDDWMKTLKDARVGDTLVVTRVNGEGAVRRRIMDMGITKNVEIFVRKMAPLGDPMELNLRGYELSLRKADAEMIEVQ